MDRHFNVSVPAEIHVSETIYCGDPAHQGGAHPDEESRYEASATVYGQRFELYGKPRIHRTANEAYRSARKEIGQTLKRYREDMLARFENLQRG